MKKTALLLTLCSLCIAFPLNHVWAMTNSEILEHEENIIEQFLEEKKFSKVEDLLTEKMKAEFSAKEYQNFKEQLAKNFGEPKARRLFILEKEEARDLLRYEAVFSKIERAQLNFMFDTNGKKPLLDDFALMLPPQPIEEPVEPAKKYKTTPAGIRVEIAEEMPVTDHPASAELPVEKVTEEVASTELAIEEVAVEEVAEEVQEATVLEEVGTTESSAEEVAEEVQEAAVLEELGTTESPAEEVIEEVQESVVAEKAGTTELPTEEAAVDNESLDAVETASTEKASAVPVNEQATKAVTEENPKAMATEQATEETSADEKKSVAEETHTKEATPNKVPEDVLVVGNKPVPNKARVAQRKEEEQAKATPKAKKKNIPEEVLEFGRTAKDEEEVDVGSAEERAMDAKYQRKQSKMRRIF